MGKEGGGEGVGAGVGVVSLFEEESVVSFFFYFVRYFFKNHICEVIHN